MSLKATLMNLFVTNAYALNQNEYLCMLLDHDEIEIIINQVERVIRPIVARR